MVSGPQEGPATYEEKDDKLPVTKEPAWAVITRAPARERGVTAQQSCCSVTKSCLALWTPWTAVRQASLSFTISQSLLKLMSIELVMPPNHLILQITQVRTYIMSDHCNIITIFETVIIK